MNRAIVLLPLLVGCAELEPFLPKVSFDRLDVRDIDFDGVGADFVFAIENPNPIAIDVAQWSYALALEDVELLSGDASDGLQLEAAGSSEFSLPVDLVFADLFTTIEATRGEDVVDFDVVGDFGFDTPAGVLKVPYDAGGDFPALRAPKFTFQEIRLEELDFTKAELAVDLGVDNDLGSTLIFDDFAWALELGGTDVAEGMVATFDVPGATTGTVSLPIEIDLLTAGVTLVEAILDGGRIDLGLSAGVDVQTPFGPIGLAIDETGDLSIQ